MPDFSKCSNFVPQQTKQANYNTSTAENNLSGNERPK